MDPIGVDGAALGAMAKKVHKPVESNQQVAESSTLQNSFEGFEIIVSCKDDIYIRMQYQFQDVSISNQNYALGVSC